MERSKEEIFEFLNGKMTFEKREIAGYLRAYGINAEPPVMDVFQTFLGTIVSPNCTEPITENIGIVSLDDLVKFMEGEEPCVYIIFSETLDEDQKGVIEEIMDNDMNTTISLIQFQEDLKRARNGK